MARKSKGELKVRSAVARQAWSHPGAGKHDSRPRRQRTRAEARRAALRD